MHEASSASVFDAGSRNHMYSSMSDKYNGLIALSARKRIRNSLVQLFDYVFNVSPQYFWIHTLISGWRLICLVGPSLCPGYLDMWEDGIMKDFLNYTTILFTILPTTSRPKASPYFCLVYFGIMAIFLLLLLGSAFYFAKYQKLSFTLTKFIFIFCSTFCFIAPNMFFAICGEMLGFIIMFPKQYLNGLFIASMILGLVVTLIWLWIFIKIYIISITYKPISMMSSFSSFQVYTTLNIMLINFVLFLGGPLLEMPKVVIGILALVLYVSGIPSLFLNGGPVKKIVTKSLFSTYVASAFNILLFMMIFAAGQVPKEYMLIIYIVVFGISYFVGTLILNRYWNKIIMKLDIILENTDEFNDLIKKPKQFSNFAVTGFRFAHPLVLEWNIFKLALVKWPASGAVWLLYAKFTAIYPELTQQLAYTYAGIVNNGIKGSTAKGCLSQLRFVMNQRENNLVPQLKSKLDRIGKSVQQSKHKMRYVWDLIIQGNTTELESAIDKTMQSIDLVEIEFLHLLRQYPNNRFAARAYTRFLRDVRADYNEFKKWNQNCALLTRGIKVQPDLAHELGIKAFPSIPQTITTGMFSATSQAIMADESAASFEVQGDELDESAASDIEIRLSIKESIDNLKIPGYRYSRIFTLFLLIVLLLLPLIAISIYASIYLQEHEKPLQFIYSVCSIRTHCSQMVAWAHRLVCETINVVKSDGTQIFPLPNYQDIMGSNVPPPKSVGNTWDTRDQLVYIMNVLITLLQDLKDLMVFQIGNADIDKARGFLYQENVDFRFYSDPIYDNPTNPTSVSYTSEKSLVSVQNSVAELITQLNFLTDKDKVLGPRDYNMRGIVEGFGSVFNIQKITGNATSAIQSYVINQKNSAEKLTNYLMIALSIFFTLLHVIFLLIVIKVVSKNNSIIYKAIILLPKNVVSKVSDQFKVLRKDETDENSTHKSDEEYNKQEENMLKLFASSGDQGKGAANDIKGVIILTIIQIILHVGATVLMLLFFQEINDMLVKAAPNINYITSAYSVDITNCAFVTALIGYDYDNNLYQIAKSKVELFNLVDYYTKRLSDYFQAVRYGMQGTDDVPFAAIGVDINQELDSDCTDFNFPTSDYDVFRCSNPDAILSYIQIANRITKNKIQYSNKYFGPDDPIHKFVWHLHLTKIYDQFFYPMYENVVGEVIEIMEEKVPIFIGWSFVLFAISAIVEVIYFIVLRESENRQLFALKLLLHCPGNAVVSNTNITAVLQGDFSDVTIDSTTRGAEFYDTVIKDMPDSIIFTDMNGMIIGCNRATDLIYGFKNDEIKDQHISTIGKVFEEGNPFDPITNFEKEMCFMKGESKVHVELSVLTLTENIVITTRGITRVIMYNQLIAEERSKSDKLLSSILPASLVKRVQDGEKNISFAIQSVSILFMDIVSFTPWCGSLPASKVMTTLNLLFKAFDMALATHSTMTKIKCIGDCYMAAGGIFAEINQPAIHAKDTVEFGLDAIEAIERINTEIDEHLKMRVGINTGGPIVAGVLGTAKPTFEIIGPAINMAQQMEHHGVPMHIHISRSVYELIYGSSYKVKERGEIEIKNGKVVTYLVEPRKSK